jgi:hypothetical protein
MMSSLLAKYLPLHDGGAGAGHAMNIFDGRLGYGKLMPICGFILFVFALAAITVLHAARPGSGLTEH